MRDEPFRERPECPEVDLIFFLVLAALDGELVGVLKADPKDLPALSRPESGLQFGRD
jgi:hypothetical protein